MKKYIDINDFMELTYKSKKLGDYSFSEVRPRVICKDGFEISVQGSKSHYCHPRYDGWVFYSVELGEITKLTKEDRKLLGVKKSEEGIYGHVHIENVQKLLNKHGGIDAKYLMAQELSK